MRTLILAALLVGLALPSFACGPDPLCEGRTLRIVEPDDGEVVPPGRVNIVVEACRMEEDEQIRLRLTMPVESDYGFAIVEDDDQRLYGFDVPTLPGTMEVVADVVGDPTTVSDPVAFDVAEE
ncbi:MAG: hypothetical protein JJ863_32215 [Deltaproteobacteria bacterium]|nr:hypothetical protein [Deltaproteobacteria bacterium]